MLSCDLTTISCIIAKMYRKPLLVMAVVVQLNGAVVVCIKCYSLNILCLLKKQVEVV